MILLLPIGGHVYYSFQTVMDLSGEELGGELGPPDPDRGEHFECR
jgi:hypothetical protein